LIAIRPPAQKKKAAHHSRSVVGSSVALRGASIQPAIIDDRADLAAGSEISTSAKTVSPLAMPDSFRVRHPARLLEGDD